MATIRFELSTDDVTEEWSVRDVALRRCPIGWGTVFTRLESSFTHIDKIIKDKTPGTVVPRKKDLFRAFHLCALDRVKVVIFGQDPYYTVMEDGTPDATGLAFSTWRDSRSRVSAQNIFLEVKNNYPEFRIPEHSDLSGWAEQGVLLLNTALTTIAGQDKAHEGLWMGVITAVIDAIKEKSPHTIVMLWGKDAQKLAPRLGKLRYLMTSHPSGFSANRGFFGCGHFKTANELLQQSGQSPIDWTSI